METKLWYICPECSGRGVECKWDELIKTYDDVICWQCGGKGFFDWIEYARSGGFVNG